MVRPEAGAAIFVERFFQFSVLGLVTCGYLAVASSGYLDAPTLVLAGAGLLFRALVICGLVRIAIPERVATAATLFYSAFFVADCFLISKRDSAGHGPPGVFHRCRAHPDGPQAPRRFDHRGGGFPGTGGGGDSLDRPELLRVPGGVSLFAMAALTSGEIRRSIGRSPATARSGLRRFHPRLALLWRS